MTRSALLATAVFVLGLASGCPDGDAVAKRDEKPGTSTQTTCSCLCAEPGGDSSTGEEQIIAIGDGTCGDLTDVRCKRSNGSSGFLGWCRETGAASVLTGDDRPDVGEARE